MHEHTDSKIAYKEAVSFVVEGDPVAQPRPRVAVVGGRPRVYDPTTAKTYKGLVRDAARAAWAGRPPLDGPVEIHVRAVFTRPKSSWRKREPKGQEPRLSRPDCDNIAKSVMDALEGLVYLKDEQVYALRVEKWTSAQGEAGRLECEIKSGAPAVPDESP